MGLGKITAQLYPKKGNPRNSEGSFLQLKDGGILFAYSRYKGSSYDDFAPADIYAVYSYDQGQTWSDERPLLTREQEGAANLMSTSLMRMANGDIGLFYLKKTPVVQCHMYLKRSCDEGKTWSDEVCCMDEHGYFVVNNDRPIRLDDGSILIPAAKHLLTGHKTQDSEGNEFFTATLSYPAVLRFFISRDDGKSWSDIGGQNVLPAMKHSKTGLQEPGVMQLSDGSLWCWCRTDLGRQYELFSYDGGNNWTVPAPSQFTAPESPMSVKTMPSGEIVAVWNPIPLYNGRSQAPEGAWTGARTPLVVAISRDNGKTFTQPAVLEDDPLRGFCYIAIHFTEDAMLLAYCAGGKADGCTLNRITIRKVSIDSLLELE